MSNVHVSSVYGVCHDDNPKTQWLLGLCRVIGLDYDIQETDKKNGLWTISLRTVLQTPDDFYMCHPLDGDKRRQFITVCVPKERVADQLLSTIASFYSSLKDSCQQYRLIAAEYLKDWPQFKDSK